MGRTRKAKGAEWKIKLKIPEWLSTNTSLNLLPTILVARALANDRTKLFLCQALRSGLALWPGSDYTAAGSGQE